MNKESVSGRLLTLESLLSDGSKLILTIGAVLHIYKYLIHSWKLVCIRGSKKRKNSVSSVYFVGEKNNNDNESNNLLL